MGGHVSSSNLNAGLLDFAPQVLSPVLCSLGYTVGASYRGGELCVLGSFKPHQSFFCHNPLPMHVSCRNLSLSGRCI